MANISVNEYIDIDVDIDVEEFLDECSSSEIEEVVNWLKDNGHNVSTNENNDCADDLKKLLECISLTIEDELLIKQIASKYP